MLRNGAEIAAYSYDANGNRSDGGRAADGKDRITSRTGATYAYNAKRRAHHEDRRRHPHAVQLFWLPFLLDFGSFPGLSWTLVAWVIRMRRHEPRDKE